MSRFRHLFIALLVSASTAVVIAQDGAVTSVTVDAAGRVWAASRTAGECHVYRRDAAGFRLIARMKSGEIIAGPVLARDGGGVLGAWLSRHEQGTEVFVKRIGSRTVTAVPLPMDIAHAAWNDIALHAIDDGGIALLLAGDGTLQRLDLEKGLLKQLWAPLAAEGAARRPTMIGGTHAWIAWEERRDTGLAIAAVSQASDARGEIIRFPVTGFAGEARPALARADGVALYWQESGADGRARLVLRKLDETGAGPILDVPTPAEFSGLIGPRTAVDDDSVVTAYGWNWRRWGAVRFPAVEGSVPAVRLAPAGEQMRDPYLVAGGGSGDAWIFPSSANDAVPQLVTDATLATKPIARPAVIPKPEGYVRFLAFGDSITNGTTGGTHENHPGYRDYLQALFAGLVAPAELIANFGVPGEKTPEGLARFPQVLEEYPDADYALILEGTNDVYYSPMPTLEESAENVGLMADMARGAGAKPVIGTMLPRAHDPNPGAETRARELNKPIMAMAHKRGITLARFDTEFPAVEENYNDIDGRWLHPSDLGYEIMATIWMQALATFQGDFDRDGMVTIADARLASVSLGLQRGALMFLADCDVNDDGRVSMLDFALLFRHLGRSYIDSGP